MSCGGLPADAVTAFAALSGAALGAFLSHRFSRNRDLLDLRRDVLRRVMGYRWTLTEEHSDEKGHFVTALNEALVVFAGEREVEREIERFHGALERGFRRDDFPPLAKAMARSAGVRETAWRQELLERPFT